jgi:hypothetical protein
MSSNTPEPLFYAALTAIDQLDAVHDRLNFVSIMFAGEPKISPTFDQTATTLAAISDEVRRIREALDAARAAAKS